MKDLEFKVLQMVSGHFLTEQIPDNFPDMSPDDQDTFLTDNAWEPLEYHEPAQVYDLIDAAAQSTSRFIKDLQDKNEYL